MSVSYQKVICTRSWGHIEAFGDLRSAINRLTATLFLIHNKKNHPVFSQDSANAQTIRFRTERLTFLTLFLSISDSPEQKGNCECIIVLFIDF